MPSNPGNPTSPRSPFEPLNEYPKWRKRFIVNYATDNLLRCLKYLVHHVLLASPLHRALLASQQVHLDREFLARLGIQHRP